MQNIVFWIAFAVLMMRPISLFDVLALAVVLTTHLAAITAGFMLLKNYDVDKLRGT